VTRWTDDIGDNRCEHAACLNSRAVSTTVVELIVELRQRRSRWGPRKLLAILERDYPRIEFPVASTVGSLLRVKGLVTKRRRRAPSVGYGAKLSAFVGPNSVWCADFKGQFLVAGRYCHPLTISDGYSRFLLRCKGLKRTLHAPVQKVFEDAFDEFGLPEVIRTDNGPPFASVTTGGLSRLAVWWVQLGILPERILPGHPEQNGRHERMHRTLKADSSARSNRQSSTCPRTDPIHATSRIRLTPGTSQRSGLTPTASSLSAKRSGT